MDKEALLSQVSSHQPKVLPETKIESAVLLIVVYDQNNNMSLVITKRAENIAFAGDYCLPGGVKDMLDRNFDLTAMREVKEELNLDVTNYKMIGQLDDFHDRSGNRVRPFVAVMSKKDFEIHARNNEEIVDIHFFPMNELTQIVVSEELEQLTKRYPSYLYHNNDVRIWGLTASILVHFGNVVFEWKKLVGNEIKK
jgi:coenzyme A diphosphatase NUDT7